MIKIFRSLLLFSIFVLGFFNTSNASHISGGDINYQCVGQDSFLVTLNLYRDCAGLQLGATTNMNFVSTCGGTANATLTRQSFSEVSQLCPAQKGQSSCNSNAQNALPGIQQHIYTGIVVLSPPCNSWTMSWSVCCRPLQVSNLVNPQGQSTYIYSTMFSGIDSCNNSPTFTAVAIPYVCVNQTVNYNFGAVEPDGDSLVYFLSPAFDDPTTLIPYTGTYTFNQPFPGANLVLNPLNGQLTFTPTAVGTYVIAVRVEEYDAASGVIKGTSLRDVQVVVIACSGQQQQPEIDAPGIFNFSGSGIQLDSNSVEVCVGDNFSFDVSISDADTQQTVNILHNIYAALDSSAVVTITPGNPAILNVSWTAPPYSPSFTSFIVTGVDDACPVVGLVSGVFNVYINPSTYAGPDQEICAGTQWVDLPVVGGSSFIWTTISGSPIDTIATSPNFNMTCRQCDNPSVSPQVTTTYVVISNMSTTCTNIDTVTVTVHPNFNITLPNDTIICPIDSINLAVTSDQPTFTYVYDWAPSGTLSQDSISNPWAFPTAPTNYNVTVENPGGCVKTGNVFVDLSPPFPPGITVMGDTTMCLGDSTQLIASLGDVTPASCGLSISPCIGNPNFGIIGTGTQTTTNTMAPGPYGRYFEGARHQILFTAAELRAMGMLNGGKITSIAFDVTTLGVPNNMDNFEVKMGCTSSSDLTGGWETGLVTVLPGATYYTVSGWNTHTFTSAYDWDGISNLVVEVCYNNSTWSAAASSLTSYTPTTFPSVLFRRADNANVCSATIAGTTSPNRPNMRFGYCSGANPTAFNYSWTPSNDMDSANSQSPIVWPSITTNYQVVVQDTFGSCSDTIEHLLTIVTEFDAGFEMPDTICLNGGTITCIPNIGGGVFSGVGIIDSINGVFDPSISGEGTFPINYLVSSPTGNCMNDSTINIEVIPATDPSFSIKEFCFGSAADTLVPMTPGGSWSGIGMIDSVSGIFDPSIGSGLPVGDYPITYSISEPCIIDTTMIIRIIEPYTFVLTNAIVPVCVDATEDLNLNYTLSSNPLQGNGPVSATWFSSDGLVDTAGIFNANAAPGDYTISLTITGADGTCGTTQTFIVRINPVDYATATQELAYCSDNQQARIFINPWLIGAGVTFTQTPIAPLGATDTLNIAPYGQNGVFDATIQGVGQWALEMTYVNVYGCTGITNDTIYVVDTPDAPTIDDASYCEGDSVFLSATGVTQDSIYWHGNALLTDTIGVGNPTYWNIAPDPSLGDVFVWVTENNWVCVSPKVLYKLPLKPSPVATFAMTYQDSNGAQAVAIPHTDAPIYGLTPLSVSFNSFSAVASDTLIWYHHWEKNIIDPQEVNTSNSSSVMWNYTLPNLDKDFLPIDGTEAYINQLVVINEFGCVDTAQAEIYSIASEQFYNVFTPNDDGINDIFTVPVFGLTDYKVQIFNRWGKNVYEWTDPEGGWSGEDQPNGVYFYVVTGINNDAQKSEYKQQGSVTLMGSED